MAFARIANSLKSLLTPSTAGLTPLAPVAQALIRPYASVSPAPVTALPRSSTTHVAHPPPPRNEMYQYSVMNALMEGVADDGIRLRDLLNKGNHGLGTFKHMNGEMIVLDGEMWQMLSDGSVNQVDLDRQISPFCMVTQFDPSIDTQRVIKVDDNIDAMLNELAPTALNTHLAFRLDGKFSAVMCRTAKGQEYPGAGLKEVTKTQVEHTFGPVHGTVIGFRSPQFLKGIAVSGIHMHFITNDRSAGGHVLAVASHGPLRLQVSELWRTVMDFPQCHHFNAANLESRGNGHDHHHHHADMHDCGC